MSERPERHPELQLQERSEGMGEKAKLCDMTITWVRVAALTARVSAIQVFSVVRLLWPAGE